MITYLDPSTITDKRQTNFPVNRSRTGYGSKIATSWLLKIGKQWHRVYVICYSNNGSSYVLIKGQAHYLGAYSPTDRDVSARARMA
jgi:hypothetical protein